MIAVVRARGDDEVVARVKAELEAMDFEVVDAESGENGAVAVIEVKEGVRQVELWTRKEGATDLIAVRGEEEGVEELALGVVEALRARLEGSGEERATTTTTTIQGSERSERLAVARDERAQSERSSRDTNATTSTSTTTSTPTPAKDGVVWVEAAPAVIVSTGGLAAEVSGFVGARWQAVSFGSIAGFATVPLWRDALRDDEGTADVSTWLLGIAIDAHVQAAPFELAAGLGVGSAIVVMSGEASGAFEGRDETLLVPAPLVRASVHWDLGALRLVLRAHAGLSIPRVEVRFDQREAAYWGQPFVAISLGAELPLVTH